jgi:ribose transport system permease protein
VQKQLLIKKGSSLVKFRESGILLALFLLCFGLSIARPSFLSQYNLGIVLRQVSYVAIVALGQTLVLISGGIDLSVGATAGLSAIIGSIMMATVGIDAWVSTAIAVLIGASCGLVNGLFIAKVKLNPFIVTLAASEVYGGLILVITKGYPVMGIPEKFRVLGRGMLGPVPVPVVIMLVLAVIMTYILRNTPFGRYVYALGGNESAARLVGIRVERIKVAVYAISGSLAALSGMIYVSRMNAGQPTIGEAWLMPSVTAAIIGGTSLSGGEGTILGTIIGAVLMGVLANGIVLLNVSSYWEKVIIGTVVVVAVIIDMVRRHGRKEA